MKFAEQGLALESLALAPRPLDEADSTIPNGCNGEINFTAIAGALPDTAEISGGIRESVKVDFGIPSKGKATTS